MKGMERFLLIFLGLPVAAYAVLCLLLFVRQRDFLYFPSPTPFVECPALRDGRVQTLPAPDGSEVRAYWRPATRARASLLFFHGNAGSACDRLDLAELFAPESVDQYYFEYPGYGGDPSPPSQPRLLELAREAIGHVRAHQQAVRGERKPLILIGESLGSGVATAVAADTDDESVEALILVSPYTSIADVAGLHYPFFPVRGLLRDSYPAREWAPRVKAPVWIFHGDHDDIIPAVLGREQSRNFPNLQEFSLVLGAGHNDLWFTGREQIQAKFDEVLLGLTGEKTP